MSNVDRLAPAPDYLKAYSLTCEPFANDLDGRFFYAGSALMQRLDLLTHLTQFGDSVILVSGPRGSGKTTLLGRFAGQTGNQWRLCLINADEFGQFPRRLGDALGIGDTDDERQMVERWASQTEASQLLVIVIDNAEQLQPEAFQTLCRLLEPPLAERVRLILFGTPEAQQALKLAFDQKELPCNAQLLEVPRLTEEETASYLMYRLAVAGYSGESPFTATEVRALCKAAEGRPADINRLAHDALLEHQMRSRGKRPRPKIKPRQGMGLAWTLSSLVVIAIAIYVGLHRQQPAPKATPAAEQPTENLEKRPLALPESRPTPTEIPPPTVAGKAPETARAPVPDLLAGTDTPPPATAAVPAATPSPAAPALPASGPEPAPGRQTTALTLPPAPAVKPRPMRPPAAEPPPAATGTEAPVAAQAPTATAQPVTGSDTKTVASPAPAAGLPHREAWLLQQPEQRYSLQLLGSRKADSITDYIRQHKLAMEQSAIYRGKFRGGEWYVLMYGIYPDRQAAIDARAGLPAAVRKDKPWPRTLKSVQTAIHDAR